MLLEPTTPILTHPLSRSLYGKQSKSFGEGFGKATLFCRHENCIVGFRKHFRKLDWFPAKSQNI